jgi:glycosyltransferase involved in cell wall biosynthesis
MCSLEDIRSDLRYLLVRLPGGPTLAPVRTMKYCATIVIPVLNQRADWLRKCVFSALNQTAPAETIVVTSPATSVDTVRSLTRLATQQPGLRVLTEERPGFAAALNTGIRSSSAMRIGFLLSDDWLDRSAVGECLGFDSDIVSTGMRGYLADGERVLDILCRTPSLEEWRGQPTLERKASYLKHFLFFQRRKLLEAGGVDEKVGRTGPDDFDLIWTMLERGASVSVVGKQLYNYRDHGGERLSLRSVAAQTSDLCRILDKHGVFGPERKAIIAWHSASYGRLLHLGLQDKKARGLMPPGTASSRGEVRPARHREDREASADEP